MIHENRRRAESFGNDAERYDRARPSYPSQLVDDLVETDTQRVLDVGCGTGIASRLFAARGLHVQGVEPDPRMAAVARRNGIEVHIATFEAWERPSEPFDLLIAAQAWHWISPEAGAAKAAQVLRARGRLGVFWNSYTHTPNVHAAFSDVYARHTPELLADSVTLGIRGTPRDVDHEAILERCGFEAVERRQYPWKHTYGRDQWLDQLPTHSDHQTMPPAVLDTVLHEISDAIDRLGGHIEVHHTTNLISAQRSA